MIIDARWHQSSSGAGRIICTKHQRKYIKMLRLFLCSVSHLFILDSKERMTSFLLTFHGLFKTRLSDRCGEQFVNVGPCYSQIVWHLKSKINLLNDKSLCWKLFNPAPAPPRPPHRSTSSVWSVSEACSWWSRVLVVFVSMSMRCLVKKMVRSFLTSCAGLSVYACVCGWLCVSVHA